MGSGGRTQASRTIPVAGTWLGGFLLHALLIPVWIVSPLCPIVALVLLFQGYKGVMFGVAVFAMITILNLIPFKYRPGLIAAIQDLDMGKYYARCELRGALDQIVQSGGLYCYHPHGILSVGYCANGVWSRQFQQLAGEGLPPAADARPAPDDGRWRGTIFLIADNLRRGAFSGLFKVLCDMTARLDSATKEKIHGYMAERRNVAIIPGGFQDATLFAYGKERTAISQRKGLIKYALQHGYKVFPIYTFGESETYASFTPLLKFRLWLNKYDIPGVGFFGEPLMPLMPLRSARIMTYVGAPLELPTLPEPTAAQIDEWHGRYVDALRGVFEGNKKEAGYPDAQLEIW